MIFNGGFPHLCLFTGVFYELMDGWMFTVEGWEGCGLTDVKTQSICIQIYVHIYIYI